jgi:sulfofructosephosphate aldolase
VPDHAATTRPDLSAIARPSGGFAMLAVDQREALRVMLQERSGAPVSDEEVTAFKLAATRTLTPYASAVLLDRQFVLDRAIDEAAVAPGCGLIAAADDFVAGPDEIVGDVRIDEQVDPAHYAARGAVAMKLLVLWRPDEEPGPRVEMVRRFVERCREAALLSIIEPVSRKPRDGRAWDWDAGVLEAARELGDLGADLYKAEVPRHGEGDETEVRRGCAAISEAVSSPWVVLSSGVTDEVFPRAVELAVSEGASGFLAGRAVWRACLSADDVERSLRDDAVGRLRRLCEVVDTTLARTGR